MHSHLCKPITGGGGRGRVAQYLKSKYGSIAAQWKKCPVADPPSDEAGESSVNWKLEEVYRRGTETVQPDAGGVQRVDSVVQQAGTALQGNSPQVTGKKRVVYDAVFIFNVLLD